MSTTFGSKRVPAAAKQEGCKWQLALRDAINARQQHGATCLGNAVDGLSQKERYDRLIVITDEQAHDTVPAPDGKGYVINVASYKNGVGYGRWMHIGGGSDRLSSTFGRWRRRTGL